MIGPRAIASMLLAGVLAAGCGYQQAGSRGEASANGYQWHSLYREDIQTVAVPIFTNRDYHRGLEFALSKAVVTQLEAHSPYKVVPKERADTILEGEIVSVSVHPVSHDPQSVLPQEQLLGMRVNFVWKELRTGRILRERKDYEQTAAYYPTLGESPFAGSQSAVEKLALAIVQELQADW